jgi:sulfur carrier protein
MSSTTATPLASPAPVTLNGSPVDGFESIGISLADLLARHPETRELAPDAIASAINQRFVPRAQRAARLLQAGDAVTVFQAIVGG